MDLRTLFGFRKPLAQLEAPQLQSRLEAHPKPFLLDVRQPEEYREGHLPGARLIPLDELNSRLQELPRDREIICICHSGSRSSMATRQLTAAGYRAVNLRGGMIAVSYARLPIQTGTKK